MALSADFKGDCFREAGMVNDLKVMPTSCVERPLSNSGD